MHGPVRISRNCKDNNKPDEQEKAHFIVGLSFFTNRSSVNTNLDTRMVQNRWNEPFVPPTRILAEFPAFVQFDLLRKTEIDIAFAALRTAIPPCSTCVSRV